MPKARRNKCKDKLPRSQGATIAVREYYGTSSIIDTPDHDVEEVSSSLSSEDASAKSDLPQHVRTMSDGSIVDIQPVEPGRVPSPTASEIIANCHEEDMIEMRNVDQKARAEGVEPGERKKRLLELQEQRNEQRKLEEKIAQEEAERKLDEEFDSWIEKGKGKGKK
ncbi:hypothetical protein BKA66DRAFT_572029 [Pyrenochaeta sp. MPI-SDFR-AT-0127]|nr:hypothetical protein BKA66DRAFT_572029 [Pyrenochaeta sp. MPI-SDFR-AT-0127]